MRATLDYREPCIGDSFRGLPEDTKGVALRRQELVAVTAYHQNRRLYAAKFDTALGMLKAPLSAYRPDGAFYLWMRTPVDDTEFARGLQRDYNVLVLPGSFLARDAHGENPGKNHVRIALVAPLGECVEALGRMMQFAKSI